MTWPDIPPGADPRTKEPAMTVTPTSLARAAGITGMYLRQVRQMGILGLVGYLVFGVGYLAGGVLFGLALFRARILARWASGLLVLGTLATLALHVLPHSFERPFAVPVGIALIGLGISLWRDQRKPAAVIASDLAPARVEPAAVR